jgi:hypothetical protein
LDVDAIREALLSDRPKSTDAAAFLAWLAARGGSVVVTPILDVEGFAVSVTVRFGRGRADG